MSEKQIKNLQIVLDFLTAPIPIESLPVCDAIFLFGSSKTDQIPKSGADLYKRGLGRKIICAGKHAPRFTAGPHGFNTEAEWYADVLTNENIPKDSIILETESTNTLENVLFGMGACYKQGFKPSSLILCSIPPLCRRSLVTFRKQFPELEVFSYTFGFSIEDYTAPDRLKRVLGEFDRFKEYADKGEIIPVEIPPNVQDSFNFLKASTN